MRPPLKSELAAIERSICEAVSRKRGVDEGEVWRFIVLRDGPKAAAWLVRRNASQLHRDGAVNLVLRRDEKMPNWCRAALECLSARAGWEVVTTRRFDGGVQHRVTWRRGRAWRARSAVSAN